MVNRNVNQAEVKQRFSLRKLKIGTVSVLLGATFFLLGGNGSVKADTANPGSATVQVSASHQEQVNNQQQTQDAIKLVQQDLGDNGEAQSDQAVTIDRTIHYQEQGTNKTLADDANQNISIVPYYQLGHVTVNYVDQDEGNKVFASKPLSGRRGSAVNYDAQNTIFDYENMGYELVSNDYPQDATFTGTPQVFTIVFKHLTTPVTPDNPNVPRTVALYAAAGADQAQDEEGLYYDLVQGNKIIAKGLTKDQAWAKLAEIVSPEIVGYHLVNNKQKVIDDLIADAQANRHTVYTVYYTRDQQPTPTPAPGETPTTTPAETPVTPETTGHETATPVGGVQTGRTALVSATTTKQAASATQLPQTGTQAGRESVLGLGVAMLTTLFGLLGIKKREY